MTNNESLLILNAIPGIGNIKIPQLIDFFKAPENVIKAGRKELLSSGIVNEKVAHNICKFKQDEFLKEEIGLIKSNNTKVITFLDKEYPELLKEIPDFPVVLYVKGEINNNDKLSIAIVGSRRASVYGTTLANQFAVKLGELGFTVVSGMALGIDAAAHKGALLARARTIAILGCGLANIYPEENRRLFDDICARGAIVSEFPMKTPPLAVNFPRRNRVISGMSLGTIVAEAAKRSGALITARYALEQGREVYAVPGKIDSPTSKGVNNLIKQGAKLITGIEDILEDLNVQIKEIMRSEEHKVTRAQVNEKSDSKKDLLNDLTEQELLVYNHIYKIINYDILINNIKLPASAIAMALLNLEFKGLVKKFAGNRYCKI